MGELEEQTLIKNLIKLGCRKELGYAVKNRGGRVLRPAYNDGGDLVLKDQRGAKHMLATHDIERGQLYGYSPVERQTGGNNIEKS